MGPSKFLLGLYLTLAVLIVGSALLWIGKDDASKLASQTQGKLETCDTERTEQAAKVDDLTQKLDAKSKAYDKKRQHFCSAGEIVDETEKQEVLKAHEAETAKLEAHVHAVLKMVEDAAALSDFPSVASVDQDFAGYGEYTVSQSVTPNFIRDHCGETCDDADFSARDETVRLFIPMRLAFWGLMALEAFNELDFSDKENPPSQLSFINDRYDGDHEWAEDDPLRAKFLEILENPELVRQYGEWIVTFVKTAKPFKGSAGRGAKLWLADAWTASWAPFERIEKELKEKEDLLYPLSDAPYTVFEGWYYRRWKNTGGKPGGKDGKDGMALINEYRHLLIALANAIGLPSYTKVWQEQLDSGKGPVRGEYEDEEEGEEGGEEEEAEEDAPDTEAGESADGAEAEEE